MSVPAELCAGEICAGNLVIAVKGPYEGRVGRVERILNKNKVENPKATDLTVEFVDQYRYPIYEKFEDTSDHLLVLAAPSVSCFMDYCVGDYIERVGLPVPDNEKFGYIVYLPPLMQQNMLAVQIYTPELMGAPLVAQSFFATRVLKRAHGSR